MSLKKILPHLRDVLLITVISFLISLFFSRGQEITWNWVWYALIYAFLIGSSLWKGNELFGYLVDKKYPKKKNPALNLKMEIFTLLVFSSLNILVINYIWFTLIWGMDYIEFVSERSGWLIFLIQFGVTMIFGLIFYVMEFFRAWKKSLTQEEEFKREKLILQYEALKNQVNPHFLFNSLNTLSSLIHADPNKADSFVRKLSNVYRYILEQKDKDLVSLQSEMEFVRNYIDLQKIRFEESLRVDYRIGNTDDLEVIPNSIQMLVENAIKHNVITSENPLRLEIFVEDDHYLVVRNNLQKKKTISRQDTKQPDWVQIGLKNIKARYEYLTNKRFLVNDPDNDFIIEDDRGHFIVKLPLIHR